MTIKYSGKIVDDFEDYLERTELWKRWEDNSSQWIYKLGELVETAASRSAEDNQSLKESDTMWFAELVALQNHYGESYDMFGHYLEAKGMTSQKNGQFFTPPSICDLLARLAEDEEPSYPMTISDPTSGTGRLMIQDFIGRKEKRKEEFSPMDYIYYNMDIDYKSFLFSLLNAILRNVRSVVAHGDTLAMNIYKTYATIPSNVGLAFWYDVDYEREKDSGTLEKVS